MGNNGRYGFISSVGRGGKGEEAAFRHKSTRASSQFVENLKNDKSWILVHVRPIRLDESGIGPLGRFRTLGPLIRL